MNNRKTTPGRRRVALNSEPKQIFVGSYLAPKGLKLLKSATSSSAKKHIKLKFVKNRYATNPNSKVTGFIIK